MEMGIRICLNQILYDWVLMRLLGCESHEECNVLGMLCVYIILVLYRCLIKCLWMIKCVIWNENDITFLMEIVECNYVLYDIMDIWEIGNVLWKLNMFIIYPWYDEHDVVIAIIHYICICRVVSHSWAFDMSVGVCVCMVLIKHHPWWVYT